MCNVERREFLEKSAKLVAAAAVACATGQAGQAQAKAKAAESGLKIAVKYGMVQGNMPMLEKFTLLKEVGFDGVELNSPNDYKLEEVLEARDKSGIVIDGLVDSIHWSQPLSSANPKDQEAGVMALRKALADAKAYGATSVLLVPAVVTPEVTYSQAWERSQANIRKVLPDCEKLGIPIAVENVWNKFLLSPLEFARWLDEFESPWIGAHFDVGNVVEFGYPQEWIRVLGKRILKLDIKEYGKAKRFDYPLGEGEVDWKAVREAIADVGFQGYCTAEIRGGDREYLADVAQRMNKLLGRTPSAG